MDDSIPIRTMVPNTVASLGGTITPQSSPLASIPLEVLLHINKHLTTSGYCKFRLTCKFIEDQLLEAFAKEFFQKRQFMFTEFSLQALVDISKSRFASSLKYVIFGEEQPLSSPPHADNPLSPQLDQSEVEDHNRTMMAHYTHSTFLNTGQNVEMLAEAFSALPYLRTIGLRDFDSHSRYRDAPNDSWRSYGHRQQFLDPTRGYHRYPYQITFVYRVFQDILRGAGKASLPLMNFEIILRKHSFLDQAFVIPKYLKPTIDPVLANLRTLFLDLESGPALIHVKTSNGVSPCPSYNLMKFLSSTVKLEHLRLNFRHYQESPSILSWLSQTPLTPPIPDSASLCAEPQPVELKNLKRIDIGMTKLEPEIILGIIRKFRASIRVISLHKISLIHSADVPAEERTNLWAKLFKIMSKLDLKLDALNMSFLSQQQPGGHHLRHVSFKNTPKAHTKNWAGNDTQSGLRDFEAFVTIKNLDHDTDVEPSDGSGDENSDDSMDDLDHEEDEDDDEDDEDEDDD